MAGFDVIVIGAGIAGTSVAAELSRTHKVLLLEAESQPGYHATGRSAALFSEMYGNEVIRGLTRASRKTFLEPPADFAPAALVGPRGVMFVATQEQVDALDAYANLPDVKPLARKVDKAEALSLCPILREDYVAAGLYEPGATDIDVHGLHQAYLRMLRGNGGVLTTSSRVDCIERDTDGWRVTAGTEEFRGRVVVNAAGAWADEIAELAGAAKVGLTPCRRTAILVNAPQDIAIESWPIVVDIDEQFYFKPDAGLILLSPADETPVEPSDAQPDEWDIAVAIDRVTTAAALDVRHVKHRWAGLRSFVADRTPVVGFDSAVPGFFWLAAQGGYGVQTAPALARLAAALVRGENVPEDIAALGVSAEPLKPGRMQTCA